MARGTNIEHMARGAGIMNAITVSSEVDTSRGAQILCDEQDASLVVLRASAAQSARE